MFMIPDVQFELCGMNYYPRHYFPFKKTQNILWFVNVFDLSYASFDFDDSVNGIIYHEHLLNFTRRTRNNHLYE